VKALRFRHCAKGSLLGFLDLELASGLVLRGCTLHLSHGKHWVGLPAKPYTAADGGATWAAIVDFKDKSVRDRFQKAATAAALAACQRSRSEAVA
jgi:hypothetical protein